MKTKILMCSAMIVFTTILFISCEKENANNDHIELPASDFSVKVENNTLAFPTVNDYEKAIAYLGNLGDENFDTWEQSVGFKSMRQEIGLEKDTLVQDPLLGTIINKNYEIVIQGLLFKIDLQNEEVNVTKVDGLLKSSGKSAIYSTQINLLDKLFYPENYTEPNETKLKGWFHDKDGTVRYEFSSGDEVKCKVSYQKAAVYFSLLSDIKHINQVGCGGTISIGYKYLPGCYYDSKKKGQGKKNIPEYADGGNCREYDRRPYESSRGLEAYNLSVEFWLYDAISGESGFSTLTISD